MKLLLAYMMVMGLSLSAFAADDYLGPLNERDVRNMLSSQGVKNDAIQGIIEALKKAPGSDEKQELKLSAALFTHGGNMAFFVDNDSWNFDAVINDRRTGELAEISDLFEVYYWNGGFKFEIAYKWVWVFLPENISVESLDGSTFGGGILGRGIALKTNFGIDLPVAIEGGWVAREKGPGQAFIIAAIAGITGIDNVTTVTKTVGGKEIKKKIRKTGFEIMFPKLQFRQKKLLP